MTMVVVAILGAGLVLIASSLDNSSIVGTFQKIISGKPLDLTGSSGSSTTTSSSSSSLIPSTANQGVNAQGNCPSGYTKKYDSSGLPYCVPSTN